jgi:protein TonB
MGYQALLFCPDEKTARTVTQVLSELEFNVEACTEPFAAVKKLMGQHFDAVVVDCDNEQNATLLFKSARNSTSNQASLAVAIVEGQAGVAKAFRIGANLVLTKPINIEQSKGTLRVARGLLRKSEPAKGAVSGAPPVAPPTLGTPNKPTPNPISVAKPAPPNAAAPVVATPHVEVPAPKPAPTQAWPAAASASAAKREQDDDLLEIETKESDAKATVAASSAPSPTATAKPAFLATPKVTSGSGAASAPAPAREVGPAVEKHAETVAANAPFEKLAEAATSESTPIVGSAPSFSFGGSSEAESSGGSKKIFIGIAAAVVVAGGLYFGWTQFHGSAEQSSPSTAVSNAPITPAAPKPSGAQPAKSPAVTAPALELNSSPSTSNVPKTGDVASVENNSGTPSVPAKAAPSASSAPSKAAPTEDKPEAAPLVVKGGNAPSAQAKSATADAPAPSMIGLAAPGTAAPPPNLVTSINGLKPVLQSMNVSQGVSQGLLIKKVPPTYPANALRMRVEGTVELQATISKNGDITHVKAISGDGQLTRSATDAVKQWKYKPYLLNGEPVEIQTQITINFKLPQ